MVSDKLVSLRPLSFKGSSRRLVRFLHQLGQLVLPALILLLVRADITGLAIAVVFLAKWRILSVRPRFWPANIRAAAIDIIVGLAAAIFIIHATSLTWQIIWAVLYAGWLVELKPGTQTFLVGLQAIIGEFVGLVALYIVWGGQPSYVLAAVSGLVCYLAARHFFDAFEETHATLLAYLWGAFAAALAWLMSFLLFFYGPISQPVVLLSAISVGVGTLYYLDHIDKSSKLARRQVAVMILIIVAIILVKLVPLMFYVWSDNVL